MFQQQMLIASKESVLNTHRVISRIQIILLPELQVILSWSLAFEVPYIPKTFILFYYLS